VAVEVNAVTYYLIADPIAQRYLESLGAVAKDANKLVFMPYEASGVLSSLGGIRELLTAGPLPTK
jgi:hypothetical protein